MKSSKKFSRVSLAITPTPIQYLQNFSREIGGPEIYMKRDDNTGLAFGGNKARKLEYLIADALEKNADVVLTEGGLQSNHARMTAAAARKFGLKPILILNGDKINNYQGNLLIDKIVDAEIIRVDPEENRYNVMINKANELKKKDLNPYIIPTGGSTPLGTLGYIDCIKEITEQSKEMGLNFDWIIHPIGSGGTQTGLIAGKKLTKQNFKILGIAADNEDFLPEIIKISEELEKLLGEELNINEKDINLNYNYYGPKYGVPSKGSKRAMKLLARTEGILIGPIYTGKALAGLIDLREKGKFSREDKVLFIHTGGAPAVFAFEKEILK